MMNRSQLALLLGEVFLVAFLCSRPLKACWPAPRSSKPVVNADQTVIMIWDAATTANRPTPQRILHVRLHNAVRMEGGAYV